ncbi:MAG: hypothetical protein FJ278_00435 [Planctomycetes bacterium]|nr:hypothetical protein [Planctomycetota bacterium]
MNEPTADTTTLTPTAADAMATTLKLLISDRELAGMLGCSRALIWRLNSAGRIPLPVHVGGLTRWRVDEVRAWVAAGAPPRTRWTWPQGGS